MSKAARKKKSRKTGFPPAETPAAPVRGPGQAERPPMRWGLLALFLSIAIGGTYLAIWLRPRNETPRFGYRIERKFPHDSDAFTQGLLMDGGFLWESTGRRGESTIRKVDLKTGDPLIKKSLDAKYFGEGLALLSDKFYQLTWTSNVGFIYDRDLNPIGEFRYDGEGWGLTTDGTHLIMSDGSAYLMFLDPDDFQVVRTLRVTQPSGTYVGQLNELEFIDGKIYANRYESDLVYEIDADTGVVEKVIDFAGIWKDRPFDGVLNGIAFNPDSGKMLVTGKLCPFIYEVTLVPQKN